MFQIPCGHCGLRNVAEFRHAGEQRRRPDPQTATPEQWRGYLYTQVNEAGWTRETWYHRAGCRRFVSVQRHTVTNEIRPVDSGAPPSAAALQAGADAGAPDAGGAAS